MFTFGGRSADSDKLANVELSIFGPNKFLNCRIPHLPEPVTKHATVKTNIGIITCGGFSGNFEKRCYKLASNNSWEAFPKLNEGRTSFAMGEGSGKLFAIGGTFPEQRRSMEWINLNNGTRWTKEYLNFSSEHNCMTKFNRTHLILTGGIMKNKVSIITET